MKKEYILDDSTYLEVQKQAKLIYDDGGMNTMKAREVFWGQSYVLYLNLSGSYVGLTVQRRGNRISKTKDVKGTVRRCSMWLEHVDATGGKW